MSSSWLNIFKQFKYINKTIIMYLLNNQTQINKVMFSNSKNAKGMIKYLVKTAL